MKKEKRNNKDKVKKSSQHLYAGKLTFFTNVPNKHLIPMSSMSLLV